MNKKEFSETISKGVTVIDFFAEWCFPCKGQAAILSHLEENESVEDVKFLKLDVDKDGRDFANDFEIKSIPTIIIFKSGQEKFRFVGVTTAEELMKVIEEIKKE